MKVAMVGPQYGGIGRYVSGLARHLRQIGCSVDIYGSDAMSFSSPLDRMRSLSDAIPWAAYDLIHFQYGTYDAEQLLPVIQHRGHCPTVCTVHSLTLELFDKLGDPEMRVASNAAFRALDGFLFFTHYSQHEFAPSPAAATVVTSHPPTHEHVTVPDDERQRLLCDVGLDPSKPLVSVLGYPSRWKDPNPVLRAADSLSHVQFVIGGPWWTQRITSPSPSNVRFIDRDLEERLFVALIESSVGLLPYRPYRSFIGSGLLPNYLSRGATCVASAIPPLLEYLGDSPYCIDLDDSDAVSRAVSEALSSQKPTPRRDLSYSQHAEDVFAFYKAFL